MKKSSRLKAVNSLNFSLVRYLWWTLYLILVLGVHKIGLYSENLKIAALAEASAEYSAINRSFGASAEAQNSRFGRTISCTHIRVG